MTPYVIQPGHGQAVYDLVAMSNVEWVADTANIVVIFLLQGLDMTPYVIQPGHGQAVYDLVAVSNHYGGMGGGHCK
jgi:hypothetical protein